MDAKRASVVARPNAHRICRGSVLQVASDGLVAISCPELDAGQLLCHVLVAAEGEPLRLAPLDDVLVWLDGSTPEYGVILGRIGRGTALAEAAAPASEETPDELTIEAKHSLTLRVGGGSIIIRDGRILIKGKDLVSHAQRTNRIKGGAVAIN